MPPDESRSEGTPSHSEAPNAGAKPFGYFGAFAKVTRRKGETASRNGGVRNFVFGHNMSKRCMYANQKETRVARAAKNPERAA